MRASQLLLTGCCFLVCSMFVCGDTFAQSETQPPAGKIGFALAELADGKIKLDFGKTGTPMPVVKNVEQRYTVAVPYTVKVITDGKEANVTRTRMETRTRTVPVTIMKAEQFRTVEMDELKFFKSNGEEMRSGEVKNRMETKQAIVVLSAGQKLDEFYMSVLRDDVIIAVLPKESDEK